MKNELEEAKRISNPVLIDKLDRALSGLSLQARINIKGIIIDICNEQTAKGYQAGKTESKQKTNKEVKNG